MSLEFSLDVVLVDETIPVGVTARPPSSEYKALVSGASLFSEVKATAGSSLVVGTELTFSLVAGAILGTSLVFGAVLAISSAYTFEDD